MSHTPLHRRRLRGAAGDARAASRRVRAGAVAACAGLIAGCGGNGAAPGTAAAQSAPAVVAQAPDAPGTVTPEAPAPTSPAPSTVDVAATLQLLNAARAQPRTCGTESLPAAPPLRWNAQLEQAAIGHSQWMQANDTLSHTGAGGSSVGTRVTAAGYAWSGVGENIAAGQPDTASVVASWLSSAGHCRNIMRADFADTALALVRGTSSNGYRTWWTLVLGRPR